MSSALSRAASRVVKGVAGNVKGARGMAGGGYPGGYWSVGTQKPDHVNGILFGETPPKPGQSRIWEDWELPW